MRIPKLARTLGSGFHSGPEEGEEGLAIAEPRVGMTMLQRGRSAARFGTVAG